MAELNALTRHKRRNMRCEDCGQSVNQYSQLYVHMLKCHGVKLDASWACPVCGLICKNQRGLWVHVKLTHWKTPGKLADTEGIKSDSDIDDGALKAEGVPFACPICEKEVPAEETEAHFETHTEEICAAYEALGDVAAKVAISKALLTLAAIEGHEL